MNVEQRKNQGDLRAYTINDWLTIMLKQIMALAVFITFLAVVAGSALCLLGQL